MTAGTRRRRRIDAERRAGALRAGGAPLHRFAAGPPGVLPRAGRRRLVVASTLTRAPRRRSRAAAGGGARAAGRRQELGAWLHIAEDGTVTVYTGKVEVGQDIRTSLTQAVLEELPAPPRVGAPGHGRHRPDPVRRRHLRQPHHAGHGAAAAPGGGHRAAAAGWPGPPSRWKRATPAALTVADGKVTHAASGRSLGFGALTRGQKLAARWCPRTRRCGRRPQWTVAGQSLTKVDARAVVTGAAQVHLGPHAGRAC